MHDGKGSALPPLLLQLEYLSAEDWVEAGHGLPSLQPDGLVEYFFNPGFTARTGGLLRERDLLAQRDLSGRSREPSALAGPAWRAART